MKNKSEDIEFRTFDSDKNISVYKEKKYKDNVLPSSKNDINKFDILTESIEIGSITNYNNQSTTTSSFNLNINENLLYGNDFMMIEKPRKLGNIKTKFYINKYPLISFGHPITYPLLLIIFISLLYILFHKYFYKDSVTLLKNLFNLSFWIYFLSYILLIFINPGIPTFKYHQLSKYILSENKNNKYNKFSYSKCKRCNLIYKLKDKVTHCKKCNICYFGNEKHFFLSGHCIAKNNKIFYVTFALSFFIFGLVCFTMIFTKILKLYFIK